MIPQRVRLMRNAATPGSTSKTPTRITAGSTKRYAWMCSKRIRRRRASRREGAGMTPGVGAPVRVAPATLGDDRCAVPIYDYRCDHCGHAFSIVQSYKDEALSACPSCGKLPRRVVTAPAIVFKGSGWYKTDKRASAPAEKDGAKATGGDAKPATKSTDAKTEAKPAAS